MPKFILCVVRVITESCKIEIVAEAEDEACDKFNQTVDESLVLSKYKPDLELEEENWEITAVHDTES